jgi:hypothetical protein
MIIQFQAKSTTAPHLTVTFSELPEQKEVAVNVMDIISSESINVTSAGTGFSGKIYGETSNLQRTLRVYTHVGASSSMHLRSQRDTGGRRAREMEWRRTHRAFLRTLAGQWVVLEGEELIAHGTNLAQMVTEARARGIRVPYVFYVEEEAEDVIRVGL